MTLLHAILLGALEGLTEFLPISSTAHLILASHTLRLPQTEALKSFEIAIQLGAIAAVLLLYGKTLLLDRRVLLRVAVAFVPTGVIGFVLYKLVKQYLLESLPTVLWSLLLGGIVLIAFDWFHREKETDTGDVAQMTYLQAFLIGLCQSLAMVPGVSRAAATIIGGEIVGMKRKAIVDFSFLLAIPTMAAATGYDLLKSADSFSGSDVLMLIAGAVTSFIVAYVSVKWFLGYIKNHSFVVFGVYRIIVATVGWILIF